MTVLPVELVRSQNAENRYLSFLDVDSLLSLSQTTKKALEVLNNDYFHTLFQKLHPKLESSRYTFQFLKLFHPDKCWKVACWILCGASSADKQPPFPHGSTFTVAPHNGLINQRLRELNGSCYQDPASELHKAWMRNEPFSGHP